MSVDKLVDSTQLDSDLTSVANAIRAKSGGSGQLAFPSGFVSAVEAIETGGSNETVANALTSIPANAFTNAALSEKINFMKATSIGERAFKGVTGLKTVVFPAVSSASNFIFADSGSLECADFGPSFPQIKGYYFSGQYSMTILVLRSASVVPLQNNGLDYSAFYSNSSAVGGTVYVPENLVASYRGASNWSTILSYSKNSIQSIESTHTDPDAPFDMTLYYADGTPISAS